MGVAVQRKVGDVLQDILSNLQEIIRAELLLAKAELKEKGERASKPLVILGAGVILGILALGFLLLAAVYGLALVIPQWLAALIVGVALAIFAGILTFTSRKALRRIDPVPERTVQTVKENVQWTKDRIR